MEPQIDYEKFLKELDNRLKLYFSKHSEFICCKAGCSSCCQKGDYPLSNIELEYLMQGYMKLENSKKLRVQNNFKNMVKGGVCPFLLDSLCSVYQYRPIICRTHGLAYLCNNGLAKLPYCTNDGKNYSEVYSDSEIKIEPISENLDTGSILKDFSCEIRNLYDWINLQ